MSKKEDLGLQPGTRLEKVGDKHSNSMEDRKHGLHDATILPRLAKRASDGIFGKDRSNSRMVAVSIKPTRCSRPQSRGSDRTLSCDRGGNKPANVACDLLRNRYSQKRQRPGFKT